MAVTRDHDLRQVTAQLQHASTLNRIPLTCCSRGGEVKSDSSNSSARLLLPSKAFSGMYLPGQDEGNLTYLCGHRSPSWCPPSQEFPFSK